MNKYIEVIEDATLEVVRRFDVTLKSENQIGRIESGLDSKVDHEKYTVKVVYVKDKLPEIQ